MPHEIFVDVMPGDIDDLGHANNTVYLRWLQEAAVSHSGALGLGTSVYLDRQQCFVVHRHEIDYLRPARLGDRLRVETRITEVGLATSERRTRIRRAHDGLLLVRAVTRWAFMDLSRSRAVRIPEDIRYRLVVEPEDEDPGAPR